MPYVGVDFFYSRSRRKSGLQPPWTDVEKVDSNTLDRFRKRACLRGKMAPPGFYKLHYGGIPSGGSFFLKTDTFFPRFIETKMTRSEISCRIHRLSRRDQFSRPVSRASGIFAFSAPVGADGGDGGGGDDGGRRIPSLAPPPSTRAGGKYPRSGEPLTPISLQIFAW